MLCLPCFLSQLSEERLLLRSRVTEPGSIDTLPMLSASSPLDSLDVGLEFLSKFLIGVPSGFGDLGAVNDEYPDGGLAVRITGAVADISSRGSSFIA